MSPVVAIDASRNRSGGAKAHLLGILSAVDPRNSGIEAVHVWSYASLLDQLPEVPWLIKHCPPELNRSLLGQLWWQRYTLPREIVEARCDILLSTDAGTVCRFEPSIVMSRDMLSFEGNEMKRYSFFTFSRLRLFILKHIQVSSLQSSTGALFLTNYAATVIQKFSGNLRTVKIIPHGVGAEFRNNFSREEWPIDRNQICCVYVSNADLYKHQWHVVSAMSQLRKRGFPIKLKLVGGGFGPAADMVFEAVNRCDPNRDFIEVTGALPHSQIASMLELADIFIFASSCENMPNTLVEAMATGLPIACSDRGPMPEILQDGGVYFNPEQEDSIAMAVEELILDEFLRNRSAKKALELSKKFSWKRCALETWQYLLSIHKSKSSA